MSGHLTFAVVFIGVAVLLNTAADVLRDMRQDRAVTFIHERLGTQSAALMLLLPPPSQPEPGGSD